MQIVKVEAFPKSTMRSGGENYEPFDKIELIGDDQIGMLTPNAKKYLVLKNYEAGKSSPSEVFMAGPGDEHWEAVNESVADKEITAARKRYTAQKRKDDEKQARAQAAAETATQVAKAAATEQSGDEDEQPEQQASQ